MKECAQHSPRGARTSKANTITGTTWFWGKRACTTLRGRSQEFTQKQLMGMQSAVHTTAAQYRKDSLFSVAQSKKHSNCFEVDGSGAKPPSHEPEPGAQYVVVCSLVTEPARAYKQSGSQPPPPPPLPAPPPGQTDYNYTSANSLAEQTPVRQARTTLTATSAHAPMEGDTSWHCVPVKPTGQMQLWL